LSLGCREVTISSGARERRCMPITGSVCNIRCQATPGSDQGTWEDSYGCTMDVVPDTLQDCSTLQGSCELAPNEDRNVRRCWQS
jgi:hypothetical protein